MSIEITLARKAPARAELVGIAITSDEVDDKPYGLDWDVLAARGFDASVGQAHIVSGENGPVGSAGSPPRSTTSTRGTSSVTATMTPRRSTTVVL